MAPPIFIKNVLEHYHIIHLKYKINWIVIINPFGSYQLRQQINTSNLKRQETLHRIYTSLIFFFFWYIAIFNVKSLGMIIRSGK